MSQRVSGYARKENDLYQTPSWVTRALIPHIPERIISIHEPAAGTGKMADVLAQGPWLVSLDDISNGRDFLADQEEREAIITNPPYSLAQEFIVHAIGGTRPRNGFVAMLLRTDYDHAASRRDLFSDQTFAKKLVLTKRIRWIEGSTGSPSFNHAWFMWDWTHRGPPTLAYQ